MKKIVFLIFSLFVALITALSPRHGSAQSKPSPFLGTNFPQATGRSTLWTANGDFWNALIESKQDPIGPSTPWPGTQIVCAHAGLLNCEPEYGIPYVGGATANAGILMTDNGVLWTTSRTEAAPLAPHLATNAALTASASTACPLGVWRDDYASGNGAPPLFYTPSGSACSLNAGAGDNGWQVPSSDNKCWVAHFPSSGADVREWGAKSDGVTDDHAAIAAADAAATSLNIPVVFAGGTFYTGTSTLIPSTGAQWSGDKYQTAILKSGSASADLVNVTNQFVTLQNLQFESSVTRSGGNYVHLQTGSFFGSNLLFDAPFYAMTIESGVSQVVLSNIQSLNAVAGTGVDFVFNDCTNCSITTLTATNAAGFRPFAHFLFNNIGDLHCYDCNLMQASNDVYVDPGTGQSIGSVKFLGGYLDEAGSVSLSITPSGSGSISKMQFVGTWFVAAGANTQDVNVTSSGSTSVNLLEFDASEFYTPSNSGTTGIGLAGAGIGNVIVRGGCIGGQATGLQAATMGHLTMADIQMSGCGNSTAPTTAINLSGTIGSASIHDVHNSGASTPLNNTATITISNIHNNY